MSVRNASLLNLASDIDSSAVIEFAWINLTISHNFSSFKNVTKKVAAVYPAAFTFLGIEGSLSLFPLSHLLDPSAKLYRCFVYPILVLHKHILLMN